MCVAFDPQWVVCMFAFEWTVLGNKVVWPEGVMVQLYNLLRSWYNRRVNQVWRETWSKVHPAPASELLCHQVICAAFLLQFSIHLFEAKNILLCLAVLHKRPKMNFVNTFPFLKCCNQSRIILCRQKNPQRGFSNCPHVFVTELSVVKLLFAWFPHRAKIASQAGEMCKDAFFQTISLRPWGTCSCLPRKAQVFSSKPCKVAPALGVLPYVWQKGFWWSSQILWMFRGTEFQIIHGKCNPCRLIDDPMRNSLGV